MFGNENLEKYRGVVWSGSALGALVLIFSFTCASTTLLGISIPAFFLGIAALPLFIFKLYTLLAVNYAEFYRNNSVAPNYHKELRRLKRLRNKHSRAILGNKGWTSLQRSAYEDLVEVDKAIAEHTGIPYEAPARGVNRW